MQEAAALLERAYRMALLLQGRLGDCTDEAAFEPMALARELLSLLDDARVALLVQASRTSGSVLQPLGAGSGRQRRRAAAGCRHGMHGACPICKETL